MLGMVSRQRVADAGVLVNSRIVGEMRGIAFATRCLP
jgi:hypothetical protein